MFFRHFIAIFMLILMHASAHASDEAVNFISLSDLHFNPYASCASGQVCPLIDKLQQVPVTAWEGILADAEVSPAVYGADTNYRLFKQALEQVSKTATDKTRFVVVLGDMISHDYNKFFTQYSSDKTPAAYQAFVKKTLQFVSNELNQALPQQSIYVAIGNNDAYLGDYSFDSTHQFYQDTAQTFSQLIRDEHARAMMQQDAASTGYYALDLPGQPNLHLVVLNTVLFSTRGSGEGIDQAAQTELNWLDQEFQHHPNKKFLIIMHIPAGVDVYASLKQPPFTMVELWKPEYTKQFLAEVQAHSTQITGLLAGHLHMDFFQVINNIPLVGIPGISPRNGNNPGFKVVTFSNETLNLQNSVSYYTDLSHQSGWQAEYDFNAVYQPDCEKCQIINGMNELTRTGSVTDKFRLYFSMSTTSQPIAKDQNWPFYWCAIHHVTAADYLNCISTQ